MLAIRFLRSGRTNQAFFRVVLTQKSNPPKSKFIKVFGWYNPKTKESSLDKEEILEWVGKGAKPSNSLAKLLIANNITHKHIVYVPDAPGKKKAKSETDEKAPASETGEKEPEKIEEEVVEDKKEQKEVEEAKTVTETEIKEEKQEVEKKSAAKAKETQADSKDDQSKE